MRRQIVFVNSFLLLGLLLLSSCSIKTHQPAWPENLELYPTERSSGLLAAALVKFNNAGSKDTLQASMDAFRDVLANDPGNREALTYLCNQYILLATAYTEERRLKYLYYQEAMQTCELAMFTNTEFRNAVNSGSKPWEAAYTLQAEDAPAILFWVTALQYEFKEAMLLFSKIINLSWMQHALIFLDRIKEVAPEYGNGAVELAYTICYCVMPVFYGGDKLKCYGYMDTAVKKSDGYLLGRWSRGRFFHQVTGNDESARKDLQWVLEQDPEKYKDAYPWLVHFQKDAALQLLEPSQ